MANASAHMHAYVGGPHLNRYPARGAKIFSYYGRLLWEIEVAARNGCERAVPPDPDAQKLIMV